jgi:hypothetical protein
VRVYFLSHFHTDHLVGLTPSWALGVIYCTAVTRALLIDRYDIAPSRVISIPLDIPTVVSLAEGAAGPTARDLSVTVTLFDSNHIPGSVMIYFDHHIVGTYLYTGDFRFEQGTSALSSIIYSVPPKQGDAAGAPRYQCRLRVDHLIMDDTWLHLNNDTHFMTRTQLIEGFEAIRSMCEYNWAKKVEEDDKVHDDNMDGLGTAPSVARGVVIRCYLHNHFGKENHLQQLAVLLDAIIVVDDKRYGMLQCIAGATPDGAPNILNMNLFAPVSRFGSKMGWAASVVGENGEVVQQNCDLQVLLPDRRIEVVNSRAQVTPQLLTELAHSTGVAHIGIIMSGWAGVQSRKDKSAEATAPIYKFPYSLHCTPTEICAFVEAVRPKSIASLHRSDGGRCSTLMAKCSKFLQKPGFNDSSVDGIISVDALKEGHDANERTKVRLLRVNVPPAVRRAGVKISRESLTPDAEETQPPSMSALSSLLDLIE